MRDDIRGVLLVCALAVLAPQAASAVTPEDLVALTRAGVSDEVLIALIDADRTVYDLTAARVLDLKRAGLSDALLLKMLGTRREFAPPAEEAPPVLITGGHDDGIRHVEPAPVVAFPYSIYPPFVPFWVIGMPPIRPVAPPPDSWTSPGGFGRFMNDGTRRFLNDGWVGPPFPGTTPPGRQSPR